MPNTIFSTIPKIGQNMFIAPVKLPRSQNLDNDALPRGASLTFVLSSLNQFFILTFFFVLNLYNLFCIFYLSLMVYICQLSLIKST